MTPHDDEPPRPLPDDAQGSAQMTVDRTHLASAHGDGGQEAYPDVLATPALLSLVERACAAVLQPLLRPGEMSVGVRVELAHKAPSPLGAQVVARARYLGRERRLFLFSVEASDAAGTVATGQHARAIVQRAGVEHAAHERKTS